MKLPEFEDCYPNFTAYGYGCTNENLATHLKFIEGTQVEMAGGIASAGEVPFFVLLPHADRVVVADHSYRSLGALFVKAALLATIGPRATKALVCEAKYDDFVAAAKLVMPLLPEVIREKGRIDPMASSDYYGSCITSHEHVSMKNQWSGIPLATLDAVPEMLGRLTVIHGDLSDITKYGQLDLLYTSNCHEHCDRNGRLPKADFFAKLLKVGGSVLYTEEQIHTKLFTGRKAGWKMLKEEKAVRCAVSGYCWNYRMIAPEVQPAVELVEAR